MNDKAVPKTIKRMDVWCQVVFFLSQKDPQHDHQVAIINLPAHIAHCCRIKAEVKHKRNLLTRIGRQRNKRGCVIKSNYITNDGLLHYAPYKVVIPPSERFYETICVAEQGKKRDNDYQEPVYHSVIPNQIAKHFDEQKIVPEGDVQDVMISDIYSYVPVELPFDAVPKTQFFLVRRVLIKYSSDYKVHPKKGSCCLSDANYLRSCAKIMDKKWEDADIDSCVDVCLITGQPGPTDSGRNEILLCGRIYREDFCIPRLTDSRDQDVINNNFLSSCYNTISKSGFATHRVGGSAGDNGATEEQLAFFEANRGCYPNVVGAVLHLPVGGGKWRSYYISPYRASRKNMVVTWPYSTPQIGGVFEWDESHSVCFPLFFERMSMVRSTIPRIITSMENANNFIKISPRAIAHQEKYNQIAQVASQNCNDGTSSILDVMNKQVVYSFVAYTVGNHKDVTKKNVSKELVECKAFLHWPDRSTKFVHDPNMPALGRGGKGPGQFTVMIVDHPDG
jgi:hypothetical protein